MAKGTINGGTSNENIASKIEWASSANVTTKQSTVTATLYFRRTNSGYVTEGTGNFSITLNGETKTKTGVSLKISTSWVQAMTATFTVAHGPDGKKTVAISAAGKLEPTSLQSVNCSGNAVLDEIVQASVPTLSSGSVYMGNKVTIYTNRREAYTHTLRYQIGSSSGTIATGVGDSYEWTIPLSLASLVPSEPNPTITIVCDTYNGQTPMGSVPVALTAIVPNNETTRPKMTVTLSPTRDVMNGLYLSGVNGVSVSVAASSDYSVIDTYNTKVLSWQSSSPTYSSPNLPNVQSAKVICTVTDKRGFSTTKEETIEVIPYSWPRIVPSANKDKVLCVRCDANGNEDPTGTKLLVDLGKSYSKVIANGVQNNFCSLSYQWKTSKTGFSEPIEILSRTSESDYARVVLEIDDNDSLDNEYTIRFIAKDDRGAEGTHEEKVSTAFATFHSPVGGRGITFGGYHNPDKVNVLDCRFDAEFAGNVTGSVVGLGKLPVLQSSNEVDSLYTPGVYALANDDDAYMPEHKPGTIRVWLADGIDENKVVQEYIPHDGAIVWKRTMTKSTSSRSNWIPIGGEHYILEQGILDGWTYRKWNSGVAECWKNIYGKGNAVGVNEMIIVLPFNFSSTDFVVEATRAHNGSLVPMFGDYDANGNQTHGYGHFYFSYELTSGYYASFNIHAIGRWK